jgi:L-lactate dehydrogenase complex protein LldE
MLKKHYPQLFDAGSPERARFERLASRTHELSTFLHEVMGFQPAPSPARSGGCVVTYHDCCSGLRELGIKDQPRELLAGTGQTTLAEMQTPEACCGFGGAFSVKFGDISSAIADRKCADIEQTGAGTVVMGDLGCMLHIEGRQRRRGVTTIQVRHISEVLADTLPPSEGC